MVPKCIRWEFKMEPSKFYRSPYVSKANGAAEKSFLCEWARMGGLLFRSLRVIC